MSCNIEGSHIEFIGEIAICNNCGSEVLLPKVQDYNAETYKNACIDYTVKHFLQQHNDNKDVQREKVLKIIEEFQSNPLDHLLTDMDDGFYINIDDDLAKSLYLITKWLKNKQL